MTRPCPSRVGSRLAAALAAAALLGACAAETSSPAVVELSADEGLGPALAATAPARLLSVEENGLASNGLVRNGLVRNGLVRNGLVRNGLDTADFTAWFNEDAAIGELVMRYLVKCAAATGSTLAWTNPATGARYAWPGALGLAPAWAAGAPPTVAEQQLVSACLAALTNKYGVSVTIAVLGRTASGAPLPIGPTELADFEVKEGCFFGNLFTGEGLFVGLDHSSWDSKTSSVRACALDDQSKGPSLQCPPLYYVDACKNKCVADKAKTSYQTCEWNGVTYLPLVTRIRAADVYTCGDGTCQFTESCGSGANWDNCKPDCGLCP